MIGLDRYDDEREASFARLNVVPKEFDVETGNIEA